MVSKEKLLENILDVLSDISITRSLNENKANYYYIISVLSALYSDGYRHQYNIIFKKISKIYTSDDGEQKLNNIIYHLGLLKQIVEKNEKYEEDFIKSFIKLYDHVNLEVARIFYTNGMIQNQRSEYKQLFEDLNVQKGELKKVNNDLSNTKKAIENTSLDIIGIASLIFSAFTIITTNVSIFSTITSREDLSVLKIILIAILFNFIVVSSVFTIYKMVRASSRINESKDLNKFVICFSIVLIILIILLVFLIK